VRYYDDRVTHALPVAELFDVRQLRLVEAEAPPLPREDAAARDRVWAEAVAAAKPNLFDGPVAACAGVRPTVRRCFCRPNGQVDSARGRGSGRR
jgi:hypothetical protein